MRNNFSKLDYQLFENLIYIFVVPNECYMHTRKLYLSSGSVSFLTRIDFLDMLNILLLGILGI